MPISVSEAIMKYKANVIVRKAMTTAAGPPAFKAAPVPMNRPVPMLEPMAIIYKAQHISKHSPKTVLKGVRLAWICREVSFRLTPS